MSAVAHLHAGRHETGHSWVEAVRDAVRWHGGQLIRTSTSTGDSSSGGTTNAATVRAWLYQDVHSRPQALTAAHLGYEELAVSDRLRAARVRVTGWTFANATFTHPNGLLDLLSADTDPAGFVGGEGFIELPRLRCNTAPGWLTVYSRNGPASRQAQRVYLPGVLVPQLDDVVDALDGDRSGLRWSLKMSVALDRDRALVRRADQTVVYVDLDPSQRPSNAIADLVRILFDHAPAADGPGFSIPVGPGVYLGGAGRQYGSHGTRIAALAADAVLHRDLSDLVAAEAGAWSEVADLMAIR